MMESDIAVSVTQVSLNKLFITLLMELILTQTYLIQKEYIVSCFTKISPNKIFV